MPLVQHQDEYMAFKNPMPAISKGFIADLCETSLTGISRRNKVEYTSQEYSISTMVKPNRFWTIIITLVDKSVIQKKTNEHNKSWQIGYNFIRFVKYTLQMQSGIAMHLAGICGDHEVQYLSVTLTQWIQS